MNPSELVVMAGGAALSALAAVVSGLVLWAVGKLSEDTRVRIDGIDKRVMNVERILMEGNHARPS